MSDPLTVSLPEAARMLGVGQTMAYELAQRGEFPVRVLRVGGRWRVPRRQLVEFIEGPDEAERAP